MVLKGNSAKEMKMFNVIRFVVLTVVVLAVCFVDSMPGVRLQAQEIEGSKAFAADCDYLALVLLAGKHAHTHTHT